MTYNLVFARGHTYIIVDVDYFTKWSEAMPTFKVDGEMVASFVYNQIISRFGIPKHIVIDHGSHIQKNIMTELTTILGFIQNHSSSFYSR